MADASELRPDRDGCSPRVEIFTPCPISNDLCAHVLLSRPVSLTSNTPNHRPSA